MVYETTSGEAAQLILRYRYFPYVDEFDHLGATLQYIDLYECLYKFVLHNKRMEFKLTTHKKTGRGPCPIIVQACNM